MALVSSGLRRYPMKTSQLVSKPGRTSLTFLVIGNIAAWIFFSTLAKSHQLQDTAINLFGELPWIVLSNITLPLLLFFFFHSSVCLADTWHSAYHVLHHERHKSPRSPSSSSSSSSSLRHKHKPPKRRKRRSSTFNNLNSIMRSVSISQLTTRAPSKSEGLPADKNKSPAPVEQLHKIEEYENLSFYL